MQQRETEGEEANWIPVKDAPLDIGCRSRLKGEEERKLVLAELEKENMEESWSDMATR